MGADSKISWTDHTFNPWWGCTKVSPGCAHCYAEGQANRFGVEWGKGATRKLASEKVWADPIKWNKAAEKTSVRARVFSASMADLFDDEAPAGALDRLWALTRITPWLDWLFLTKRPENIRARLPADWGYGYENVRLGVTCENQDMADKRIQILLSIPARSRFLSLEPLLGPVNLQAARTLACPNKRIGGCELHTQSGHRITQDSESGGIWVECACSRLGDIDWVIVGGESGAKARPMNPKWARSIRDLCREAGVAFHFKQWGEWAPIETPAIQQIPMGYFEASEKGWIHNWDGKDFITMDCSVKVGKKTAGRLLDGMEHNDFPKTMEIK